MFFDEHETELEDFSIIHLRKKLKSMKGTKVSKKSIVQSILKTLPFFNKFIESAEGAGSTITSMVQIQGHLTHASDVAGNAFLIIRVVNAAIDFIRIPCIYIAAYIANQESPITLSRNARFLYSAVLLGLTITALAFPPSAPIIALVLSIAALGLSVVTLAKLYYKRYEVKDQLAQIEKDIDIKKNRITHLIDSLEQLESEAKKAKLEGQRENIKYLEEKIKTERHEIKEQLNELQKLYDTQEIGKEKLAKLGTIATLDKTAGVAFTSLALIGAIVSLAFPPAGLPILAAAASLAAIYVVGRVTYPLFKFLAGKIVNIITRKTGPAKNDEDKGAKDDLTDKDFETSSMKVKYDMAIIKKDAKRLEQLVADFPIIDTHPESELTTPTPTLKITDAKKKKSDEELPEEDEHPSI
ncbi:hypothetical protein OQJ19_06585 [Fluoribacter gormanii]|uniref:REV protein n=1 Tax=Fluoribacter gormanii TaxID=464 RepID=A0A377GES7_9GAMM|nr:hypothetical protein [Fluoribacter gormanii]KTD00613.1 coiled-coil protein [Fluoribacter gormanii]MCW8445112.1 hypothetical protein [Fluoribacter gormanii]MCW8470322.1 hypothetical protein [Fluoribacter gormanii]SIR83854.1 REV protein [Fluoribacter gormanii]STO23320.1 Uncharacterised protein [Fluoribacter gormanii]